MRRFVKLPMVAALAVSAGLIGCASHPPASFTTSSSDLHFTPCSTQPHCVSSQASPNDSHYIKPLVYEGNSTAVARTALISTLRSHSNVTLVQNDPDFVHATFKSTLGFVDDVAFIINPNRPYIDVKSSSRVGYYDFGKNRRRVENLRRDFAVRLSQPQ